MDSPEELNSQEAELSFDQILQALQDEKESFPARYLYRLSGLNPAELDQIKLLWPALTPIRRLGLLEDLELLTEGNTVMQFDGVYQIGLEDPDSKIRVTAIRSLWESEDKTLAPIFIEMMRNDPGVDVQAQAASALGRFVYLGELGRVPEAVLAAVETALLNIQRSNADPLIRRRALESLGFSSRPEAPDLIEKAYETTEEDWVAAALFAMGRSADDRWTPLVMEALRDEDAELAREAARAAGELELNEARPLLFELLQAEESEVRLAAAWALSQIGGTDVEEALSEMLERTEDEDETDLIENAIENLGLTEEMGDLNLLDFSPEDLEELSKPEEDGEELSSED
jgi:HEAT repeat protein